MDSKLISIVVAIYNAAQTLRVCVDSIVNQTYRDLEIILVDDGSKDASAEICREFEKKDSRVFYVHKENGGLTGARKKGYEVSHGEFIAFLDSDDFLDPEYVEKQLYNILRNGADVSICSYVLETEKQSKDIHYDFSLQSFEESDYISELILPRVFRKAGDRTCIPDFLWLRLFKKDIITDKCFVSEREVYTEDIFFNFEYLKHCKKVSVLDECLYHYVVREASLTHTHRENRCNMETARIRLLRRYLAEYDAMDAERLDIAVFRAVWGCIDNAFYAGGYGNFKKEMTRVRNNETFYQSVKAIRPDFLSRKDRLILAAFKCRLYMALYLYKKRSTGIGN